MVADVLTANKGEPAAVQQRATLIREHLSAEQIKLLREQLAAYECMCDEIRDPGFRFPKHSLAF